MSSLSDKTSPRKPSTREAALQAAQGRLTPTPSKSLSDPLSPSSPQTTWIQDDKSDRDYKLKLNRIVDKEIMGGNRYVAAADCIETLLQITSNILSNPTDPKYQQIKATSHVLKSKVLNAKGGEDMLRALGFRCKVIDFVPQYHFMSNEEKMHHLALGKEVLEGHLEESRKRASSSISSHTLHQTEEQSRKAEALRLIEDDREKVKARVEREKWTRERKERSEKESRDREVGGVVTFDAGASAGGDAHEGDNVWNLNRVGDDEEEEVHGSGGRSLGE